MNRTFCRFRNSARTLLLAWLAAIAAVPAFAQDTTPPVLTGFSFTPAAVNTTTSSAAVNLTAQATDDLSGVALVNVVFVSPSGAYSVSSGNLILSGGTDLNGTWTNPVTIPAYTESGTWNVSDVEVVDNANNSANYSTSDLQALGFPTQLQVTSQQDTQPPVLTGFSFTPAAVNTTTSPAAVSLTAQVTDNLSGVALVNVVFVSPSGAYSVSSGNLILTGGTDLNGTWTQQITIPAYSEPGTWNVSDVEVIDNVNNSANYSTSDLQGLGFPTQLQVTSEQDTQPPVLTGFSFTPTSVDTTTGSASVSVTAQVTDNLSGVGLVNVVFVSPSGSYSVSSGNLILTGGTDLNGTWTQQVTIPAYSEAGPWTVSDVEVIDNVNNSANYSVSGLLALGFPTNLLVDTSPAITFGALGNQALGSAPFTVSATASTGLPVSFASTTPSSCTVSGTAVTLAAAGTCTIMATQPGNAYYAAAPSVSQSFQVTEASQTIDFGPLPNVPYGTPPFMLSATATSGLPVIFASLTTKICAVSHATVTLLAGGKCTIRAAQPGDADYLAATIVNQSFQVTRVRQTIAFDPLLNQPYGAAPFTVSATATSGLPVKFTSLTPAICNVGGGLVTLVAAGQCTIKATQAGNPDYAPAQPVHQSFEVTKAGQTIVFGALTSRALGTPPFTVSATASSGLPVSFGSLTAAICTVSGNTVTLVAVGQCTVNATQAGNADYVEAMPVHRSFEVVK